MQKRLIEAYGDREADRNYPYGFGPYKLKELVVGNRVVLEKIRIGRNCKPTIRTS